MKPLLFAVWLLALVGAANATAQQREDQINLTVVNADGQPVAGVEARFSTEHGERSAVCTGDGFGQCRLVLTAPQIQGEPLIRGRIELTNRGKQPVIWPGGMLELTIQLNEAGAVDPARDVLATRGSNTDVLVQPLTAGDLAATATALAIGAATVTAQTPSIETGAAPVATPLPALPTSISNGAPLTEISDAPARTAAIPWWPLLALLWMVVGGAILYLVLSGRKGRAS